MTMRRHSREAALVILSFVLRSAQQGWSIFTRNCELLIAQRGFGGGTGTPTPSLRSGHYRDGAIQPVEHPFPAQHFQQMIEARPGVAAGNGETCWVN